MSQQLPVLLSGSSGFVGSALKVLNEKNVILNSPLWLIPVARHYYNPPMDVPEESLLGLATSFLHLGGATDPRWCRENPQQANAVNVDGTIAIAKNFLSRHPKGHFVYCSSQHVYAPSETPLAETSPLGPTSIYGETKLQAELGLVEAIKEYPEAQLTVLRIFNHSHKSQTGSYFMPSLYRQLCEIKASPSRDRVLQLGDLSLLRDFSSVQNLCRVLVAILKEKTRFDQIEIINVGSGRAMKLSEIVHGLTARVLGPGHGCVVESRHNFTGKEPSQVVADIGKLKRFFRLDLNAHFLDEFLEDLK